MTSADQPRLFTIDCKHEELDEQEDGSVRCVECTRTWSKTKWKEIEEWGLELENDSKN